MIQSFQCLAEWKRLPLFIIIHLAGNVTVRLQNNILIDGLNPRGFGHVATSRSPSLPASLPSNTLPSSLREKGKNRTLVVLAEKPN